MTAVLARPPLPPSRSVRVPVAGGVHLTARECQVLRLAALGRSNAEIARELRVEEDTVKTHFRRMRDRTGARNRVGLVALGIRAGIVPVRPGAAADFSPWEQWALELVGAGAGSADAGRRMGITGRSFDYHLGLLMGRLGAVDRAHLVLLAAEAGFPPMESGAAS